MANATMDSAATSTDNGGASYRRRWWFLSPALAPELEETF
jgi:hypothetical protein